MAYSPTEKCTTCNHPRSAHTDTGTGQCFAGAGMLSKGCDCKLFTPIDPEMTRKAKRIKYAT